MGSKPPKQEIKESKLSKEQFKILQRREALHQNFVLPELKDYYKSAEEFKLNDTFLNADNAADLASQNVMGSYKAQAGHLQKLLGQRNINSDDTKTALDRLKNEGDQASDREYNQALLQSILVHNQNVDRVNQNTMSEMGIRQNSLSMLTSLAPRTTQAAPVYFYQKPAQQGMVAQVGQAIMGSMGSMGGMMGGMGGGMGGFGGGASSGGAQASGAASSAATAAAGSMGGVGGYGAMMGGMAGGYGG